MRTKRLLAALIAVCVLGSAAVFLARRETPVACYRAMTDAAERMEQCLAAIAAEKEARGIGIDATDDPLRTGVIGGGYSAITTTLGSLPAKRTSATLAMAALCVRMLDAMGVRAGDCVGACFSGSFPGFCVALLCACDAMGAEARYTASIGSSTYGGNQAAFCTPEMLWALYRQGLVSAPPFAVTPGGDGDRLENMGAAYFTDERDQVDALIARIQEAGMPYIIPDDFARSLALRESGYGDIDAFVSVGGHVAAMGTDESGYGSGYGILTRTSAAVTETSGLLARYLAQGTPALSLLDVRSLCEQYGLPFDPDAQSVPGEGSLYYDTSYSAPLLALLLAAAAALLCLLWRETHRRKGTAMRKIQPFLDTYGQTAEKGRRVRLLYSAWRIAEAAGGPALADVLGQAQADRIRTIVETMIETDTDGGTAAYSPQMLDGVPDETLDLLARYLQSDPTG